MNFSPMIGLYFILGPMWFSLGCFLFDRKGLLCWPLVDLHSLIQYWTVSHLLHTIIFFIISRKHLVSGNALLTIPFQMTLPYTIQTYDIFLKNLKISFSVRVASCIIHSYIFADLILKPKIWLIFFINSESDTIILITEVDLCKKNSVNTYFGTCINLVNDLDFSWFSNLFQVFQSAKWHCYTV